MIRLVREIDAAGLAELLDDGAAPDEALAFVAPPRPGPRPQLTLLRGGDAA